LFGYGTFTGNGALAGIGGTYTYSVYGPAAAMTVLSINSGSSAGMTWYELFWFSSPTTGSYVCNEFNSDGSLQTTTTGSLTLK
jgi:hypothetical protein